MQTNVMNAATFNLTGILKSVELNSQDCEDVALNQNCFEDAEFIPKDKIVITANIQIDQVSGKPQLKITVDRHAIARHGLNLADVQQVIKTAIGGETSDCVPD